VQTEAETQGTVTSGSTLGAVSALGSTYTFGAMPALGSTYTFGAMPPDFTDSMAGAILLNTTEVLLSDCAHKHAYKTV
jgi:hypothetical protein